MGKNLLLKRLVLIMVGGLMLSMLLAGCRQPEGQNERWRTGETEPGHLLVIFVPGFDFEAFSFWLEGLPPEVQSRLQVAGMSMRTPGPLNLLNNMFTLAYGRFKSAPERWNAYQLSGERLIHPVGLLKDGEGEGEWGEAAEQLARKGIYTFVLGNSDTPFTLTRTASLIVMDRQGEAKGIVDETILTQTPNLPGGYRTDWRALTECLEGIWATKPASLTVVELGDLWRLEGASPSGKLNSIVKRIYRELWLEEWQLWFGQITSRIAVLQKPVTVWIVSPVVSQEAQRKGQLLAPLITWSREQKGGVLSSPTTRQYGVVANVDFLPSLLYFFHLSPRKGAYGQPFDLLEEFSHQGEKERLAPFQEHIRYLFAIYGTRRMVLTVYLSVMIVLLILTALYWWVSRERWGAKVVQVLIGAMLISPIFFLWFTPLIKYLSSPIWIGILLFSSLLASYLFYRLFNPIIFLTWIGLANTAMILLDIWRGSPWMQRSFLGFDPLIGARFYGLGNEYAGILLGSSILAVTGLNVYLTKRGLWENKGKKLAFLAAVTAFYVFLIYSMAAPQLGSNAGATIAALVTCAFSLLCLLRVKINWTTLLVLMGLVGVLLVLLAQLHLSGEKTHISLFLEAVREGNGEWLADLFYRKVSMNWKLIRVSLWGKLFTTALLVMGAVYLGLSRQPKKRIFSGQQQMWMTGFKTLLVGTVIILLVNDSGVVAAAATVIYMAFPFLFIHLERRFGSSSLKPKGLT